MVGLPDEPNQADGVIFDAHFTDRESRLRDREPIEGSEVRGEHFPKQVGRNKPNCLFGNVASGALIAGRIQPRKKRRHFQRRGRARNLCYVEMG